MRHATLPVPLPRRRTLALALAAAALLGACGGDVPRQALTITGTEMSFGAPAEVEAGDYTVTFVNEGATYHELAFTDADGTVLARRSIAGGRSIDMDVSLAPGTYELGCYEPGHHEAGMFQDLVVTA